jgi:hypothetical protein
MNLQGNRTYGILVLLAITVSAGAYAQVPTGTILGTVKDAQGLAVPAAKVTLTNQGSSKTQTGETSSQGSYEFTHLNAGLYRLGASKEGFKNWVVTNIKLDASTEYSVSPIVLEVGPVAETVTVEAGANLVRTAGAEITDTVEKQQIEELPLLGRNPLALLSTQAGVTQNHRNRSSGVDTTVINGQRQSFSNLTLDGINIQDNFVRSESLDYTPNYLFMSQVGEFTTTTQNGGPHDGMGSSQVTMVTPSGTNAWHGEGFWYYRAAAWSANDWFNNANGIAKPNLLLNQAGADAGGPLLKDKLFVYGAYELYRLRSQERTDTTVLTSAARSGIFQWRAACTTNCPAGVAPGSIQSLNVLTAGSVVADPFVAALLARVPTTINNASIGDGLNTGGYSFNQRTDESRDNTSVRVDWNPASRHSFSGTYAWNRYFIDRPGSTLDLPNTYSEVPAVYNSEDDNFVSTAWRWTPASTFTNEGRFGFNLSPVNFNTNQKFLAFTVSNTLFDSPDQNEFLSNRDVHTWSWQDNASWSHGTHLLNFGTQVQRVTVLARNAYNTIPNLSFDYTLSGNSSLVSSQFNGGISDFDLATANKLLATLGGLVGSELQTFNATSTTSGYVPGAPLAQNFRYNTWSLYAGDSWRFRKNLTVTYGLRWEYLSPFGERDGLLQFPVVPAGQTVQQVLFSDATLAYFGGSTGRGVYKRDLDNFGPNIGVAWDPFGDGRTSVRAGYCINYVNDELIGAPYNASLSNPGVSTQAGPTRLKGVTTSSPQSTFAIPTPNMSNTLSGNWIKLYGFDTANSFVYAVDPNLRTPYVQQWNLSIQREIGWNSSVTVAYVGNKGTELYRAIDLNQVEIAGNGFLDAFNSLRQNGFNSLAATGAFNVCYFQGSNPDCTAHNPNAGIQYLWNNFFGGLLNLSSFLPLINQYAQQGQVGELANLYHSSALDAAYFGATRPLAPNQFVLAADLLGNYSDSDYHAGTVEFRRRFRQGLDVQANYTFSKVFTDYSADTPTGVQRFFPYLDNANPGLEKERANFDVTHAFKANFLYQLPFGKGRAWSPSNTLLNEFVSGWTASSIFTWQSGAPFSIFSGEGTLNRSFRSLLTNTAFTTSSPQQIAAQLGVYQSNGEVLLINPKYIGPDGRGAPNDALTCAPVVAGGFCNPQPGTVGNLPRNAFNGPVFFNWDLSLLKSFALSESKNLKLRLDMFNVPNHPVFAVGDSNYSVANPGVSPSDMYINDPKFGVATSTASTPRVLQVGLVFAF